MGGGCCQGRVRPRPGVSAGEQEYPILGNTDGAVGRAPRLQASLHLVQCSDATVSDFFKNFSVRVPASYVAAPGCGLLSVQGESEGDFKKQPYLS